MKTKHPFRRHLLLAAAGLLALTGLSTHAVAQTKIPLRISTPAVPDDWHAKMWTVFKESLDKSSPDQFDTQINLNATLFKQGTEPAAMARGNLELSSISAFDIAKLVPEFSIFTAGYVVRDPQHQQKVFNGPIGAELFKTVSEKMDVTILSTIYLGTRQVNLREARNVRTPADLKGVKLRMPGSKEWLFLGEALGATATCSSGACDSVSTEVMKTNLRSSPSEASSAWSAAGTASCTSACSEAPTLPSVRTASICLLTVSRISRMRPHLASSPASGWPRSLKVSRKMDSLCPKSFQASSAVKDRKGAIQRSMACVMR